MKKVVSLNAPSSKEQEISSKDTTEILDFVKSALVGTGQKEYYNTKEEQREALLRVHTPVFSKHREFYAFLLLSQINDLNKQIIIYNLLANGRNISKKKREVENKLILCSLNKMRTSRAYRTLVMLAENKVNNSRTRGLVETWLKNRSNYIVEFVKYKDKAKRIIVHNHIHIDNEVWDFLFKTKKKDFKNQLFNDYYEARRNPNKLYELPYTIAEGFASYHNIDRKEFLEKIKKRMTNTEKLSRQTTAKRSGVKIEADWTKWELNRIYKYLYSLDRAPKTCKSELNEIADKIAQRIPYRYKNSVVIIDNSGSSYGSNEKKYHPISVSLALAKIIENISDNCKRLYTNNPGTRIVPKVRGATDLATPLIKALKHKPAFDSVFILSDGYENQIAGLVEQIIRVYKTKVDKKDKTMILQLSPVMAAESHSVRELSGQIPNVGILNENQLSGALLLLSMQHNEGKTIKQFTNFLKKKFEKLELNLSNFLLEGPNGN